MVLTFWIYTWNENNSGYLPSTGEEPDASIVYVSQVQVRSKLDDKE